MKDKKTFTLKETILIIIITGVISIVTTGIITYNNKSIAGLNGDESLQSFVETYLSVKDTFYQEVDTDKMIESAIDGMMTYLDDNYSVFMDEDETNALDSELSGEYEGIGIEIDADNIIKTVFENSPAEEQGIKSGDQITEVNGVVVTENNETTSLIAANDQIEIKIIRNNEELVFNLEKGTIEKPIVRSEIINTESNKKIGYISIESFSINVDTQFKEELLKLEDSNIDSLIIDVRNNTGGYLDKTENIIELFLGKGDIMYQVSNKDEESIIKDETNESRDYEVVILQNQVSASASEILSSAMQESYGANVVGAKSYGKGKIQQKINSSNGTSIKVTTSEWLSPEGNQIDGIGISPDIYIDFTEESTSDVQKEKAIEILS